MARSTFYLQVPVDAFRSLSHATKSHAPALPGLCGLKPYPIIPYFHADILIIEQQTNRYLLGLSMLHHIVEGLLGNPVELFLHRERQTPLPLHVQFRLQPCAGLHRGQPALQGSGQSLLFQSGWMQLKDEQPHVYHRLTGHIAEFLQVFDGLVLPSGRYGHVRRLTVEGHAVQRLGH